MAIKLLYGALAVIPSALALSNAFISPANAFEVERGPRGAYRIVTERQSQETHNQRKANARRSPVIIQGNHGAQKISTQDSVGGISQVNRRFPKLERRGSHGAYHIVND